MGPKTTPSPRPSTPSPAAAAGLATPDKASVLSGDPGLEHVAMLNHTYNLGVPLAESLQSPASKERQARADTHFRRHNNITNLLRFHHYKDRRRLEAVLGDFAVQARALHSNWVAKTGAARGTLPSPRPVDPPRAQRVEEQLAMQELLLSLLDTSKTAILQQGIPTVPRNPAAPATAPTHADSGLPHDTSTRPLPPVRLTLEPQIEALDMRGLGRFVGEDSRPRSPDARSTSSTSSASSAMYSALDSFEEQPPFGGQTFDTEVDPGNENEEFSDENWYRSGPLRRPASQESLSVSDGVLEALKESFGLHGTSATPSREERPAWRSRTAYSSIPAMEHLQLFDEECTAAQGEPPSAPLDPVPGLWDRLCHVFPPTPEWLKQAPFPIIWETTRIALHCGVALEDVHMIYSPMWEDQSTFIDLLRKHPRFARKGFPEPSTHVAWESALNRRASHGGIQRVAVYSILMGFGERSSGSLYSIHLQPISIDLPHRLSRHFGADRFLEILFPSHHSSPSSVPRILRGHKRAKNAEEAESVEKVERAVREINHWLTRQRHDFAGRTWTAFYTKNDESKKLAATGRAVSGKADERILLHRVFLFAEEGAGIPAETAGSDPGMPPPAGPLRVHEMLDWLLQFNKFPENRRQPYLKLFSRIALGLSRTKPTIVLKQNQIRHRDADLRSPTGKVMNDGVARMSLSVARKLRSALELTDIPIAVQGRLGSAKGTWILDPEDVGREDWIETYPSQRKWQCDGLDADHRTLEVCKHASEARSAGLNIQFISILEDRAIDKARMRCVLGDILEGSLTRDLAGQRAALQSPLLFSAWTHENARYRNDRVLHCQVPFLGGLPDRDEDAVQFLLAGGFDPLSQRFLWEKAYNMQKQRCEKLEEKLSIRVGRTAYLLMVVDFLGVLEEGEVQVCFSSKFQVAPDAEPDENGDDGSFSDTLLPGTDVLVARVPAHFTSDMQKVRAVFRQELCVLKDVIVFSSKGNSPLADMLSGGDYDGDMAWVCWDPRIVSNFANAPMPPKYDLLQRGYMRKIRTTVDQLAAESPAAAGAELPPHVLADMVERSFSFNMKEDLLGKLSVYKEELCYMRGSIGDNTANVLSTLLGDLVDQAKQGYDFTMQDFDRLRMDLLEGDHKGTPPPRHLEEPAYKHSSRSTRAKKADHIVDYLKFDVAKPVIQHELRALYDMCKAGDTQPQQQQQEISMWDADLAAPAKDFEELAQRSEVCYSILEALKSDIREVRFTWEKQVRQWSSSRDRASRVDTFDDPGFRQRFLQLYQTWCAISVRLPTMAATSAAATGSPAAKLKKKGLPVSDPDVDAETIRRILHQGFLADPEYSTWALLRASQAFRMLYRQRIVWRLAGRQLQVIKAMMTGQRHDSMGGAKVMMTPLAFAAMRPDRKIIKRMTARLQGTEVAGIDYDDADNLFADDT